MNAIQKAASLLLIGAGILAGIESFTRTTNQHFIPATSPSIQIAEINPTFPPPKPRA